MTETVLFLCYILKKLINIYGHAFIFSKFTIFLLLIGIHVHRKILPVSMNATVTYVIVIILHGDAFHSILECKLSIMQFTYPPLAKDY